MAIAIKVRDILNSPLNKKIEEINAKDFGRIAVNDKENSVSIKIEKEISSDGSITTHTVLINRRFTSAAELREMLEAVEYYKRHSFVSRVKSMIRNWRKS